MFRVAKAIQPKVIEPLKCVFSTRIQPKPENFGCDIIGPPNKESNLRPILRFKSTNETELQRRLRHQQDEVQNWNQNFWTNHNQRFFEEKSEFIAAHKKHPDDVLSADKMSEFYKSFLDKNRRIHVLYNISWYMKNVDLLMLSFQVYVQKLYRKIKKAKQ